jgi:hypothetical protein
MSQAMRLLTHSAIPVLAAIPVFLLAACEQKTLSTDPPTGVSTNANCNIEMKKPWIVDPQHIFTAEAMTMGPSCQKAIVALAVRDPEDNPVLAWSARVTDIIGLGDVTDVNAMKPAVEAWLDQASSPFKTSGDLPEWAAGRDGPGAANEEFPFHIEAGYDREYWEQLRTEKAPVFAFPQGRESQAVYVLRNGQLEAVGVQQFPG